MSDDTTERWMPLSALLLKWADLAKSIKSHQRAAAGFSKECDLLEARIAHVVREKMNWTDSGRSGMTSPVFRVPGYGTFMLTGKTLVKVQDQPEIDPDEHMSVPDSAGASTTNDAATGSAAGQ